MYWEEKVDECIVSQARWREREEVVQVVEVVEDNLGWFLQTC